jgi:hypothetical protein
MQIKYLSHAEEAQLSSILHEGSELAELFATFTLQLDVDTDFDTIMLSFDDESTMRIVVEDSPYVVVLDEDTQSITLYTNDDGELNEDGQYDFDEEGIEVVVDIMASRVLGNEEDWRDNLEEYEF